MHIWQKRNMFWVFQHCVNCCFRSHSTKFITLHLFKDVFILRSWWVPFSIVSYRPHNSDWELSTLAREECWWRNCQWTIPLHVLGNLSLCRFIVYSKAIICCNPNLASGGCFNTAYLFGGDVQYWLWSASDMILTSVGVVTRFVRNLESHGIL